MERKWTGLERELARLRQELNKADSIWLKCKAELALKNEQNQIMREALEKINETDTATDYDFTWLHLWRSKAKDIARQALKSIEGMSK